MKSYQLLFIGTLISVAESFFVVQKPIATKTTTTQLFATNKPKIQHHGKPLYLHVEALHPHRDSVVRLDDPIEPEEIAKTQEDDDKTKKLHHFTHHMAPVVLALYFIGHYLSTYHSGLNIGNSSTIDVDPMFGGYILIGMGLMMIKWSIDNAFLSPA